MSDAAGTPEEELGAIIDETAKRIDQEVPKKHARPPTKKEKQRWAEANRNVYVDELPHQFLLRVMQGGGIIVGDNLVIPTLEHRIEAAKAAAPYFAPRLSAIGLLGNVSDADLQAIIDGAASQAGIGLSYSRTAEAQSPNGAEWPTTIEGERFAGDESSESVSQAPPPRTL